MSTTEQLIELLDKMSDEEILYIYIYNLYGLTECCHMIKYR